MAFPIVQNAGADGVVIGASGMVTVGFGSGVLAGSAVSNVSVTGSTAYVSVKVGSGRYFGMTASSTGTGPVSVQDSSNGITLGGMASAGTSLGVPVTVQAPPGGVTFVGPLVVVGTASSPGVVVHFA